MTIDIIALLQTLTRQTLLTASGFIDATDIKTVAFIAEVSIGFAFDA